MKVIEVYIPYKACLVLKVLGLEWSTLGLIGHAGLSDEVL